MFKYTCPFQIPGLIIWSSALPESTGFLRSKCYGMQGRDNPVSSKYPDFSGEGSGPKSAVIKNETFIYECGREYVHAGKATMSKANQMLFSDICADDLRSTELGTDVSLSASMCCYENT